MHAREERALVDFFVVGAKRIGLLPDRLGFRIRGELPEGAACALDLRRVRIGAGYHDGRAVTGQPFRRRRLISALDDVAVVVVRRPVLPSTLLALPGRDVVEPFLQFFLLFLGQRTRLECRGRHHDRCRGQWRGFLLLRHRDPSGQHKTCKRERDHYQSAHRRAPGTMSGAGGQS